MNDRPPVEELIQEVKTLTAQRQFKQVVIAGEGEPTCRFDALVSLLDRLREEEVPASLRLVTNGLVDPANRNELLKACQRNGVALSVALTTHDADQYADIMRPVWPHGGGGGEEPHAAVCDLIRAAAMARVPTEVTVVERPDVDCAAIEQLTASLGAPKVRWRPYFP
jgi:wyosine [tRNA(Phe)-imidazoG37] synthetase (radical SAM superfamily)